MTPSEYTFVALDLETTGLSPETDTIIEVAAIGFRLKQEDGIWTVVDSEERSMLISPGRAMTEEISLITGITDDMLIGKPSWESVRERIEIFIGGAIIVGHNVLFDINMLFTHGIDIRHHAIIDTFELSEIFSQDAESLNLGFLGQKYHIPIESEHRALDDTRLSIGLFCYYLGVFRELDTSMISLWQLARTKTDGQTISILLGLTQKSEIGLAPFVLKTPPRVASEMPRVIGSTLASSPNTRIISLSGDRAEESQIISDMLEQVSQILIITPSKKQALYTASWIIELGYDVGILRNTTDFCSLEMIEYFLSKTSWERKEMILIIKLITWLENTKTGLLDELKYYGAEWEMIDFFRTNDTEKNPYVLRYEEMQKSYTILISDIYRNTLSHDAIFDGNHGLIMNDIISLEDGIRKSASISLSFDEMLTMIENLSAYQEDKTYESYILGVSMMRDIYMQVPERPKGEAEFPPGNFGETYFIEQKSLWHTGYTWMMLAATKLEDARGALEKYAGHTIKETRILEKIIKQIDMLLYFAKQKDENIGIILQVSEKEVQVSYIPRKVDTLFSEIRKNQSGIANIICGYGISNTETQKFIQNQCGIREEIKKKGGASILTYTTGIHIHMKKTVILTTSTKHIRSLIQDLKKNTSIKHIYGQGVSGGKGKIITLFEQAKDKSVLIGVIQNWLDESFLWKSVDEVIIAKVPFDPPTDPYFLARTVGMKNNFEEYSTPIAINTLNTLIGRIKSANPQIQISCRDERIESMNWGKTIQKNLL